MPKASEHNDEHNEETQTRRGAGFWQKDSHKSHAQTHTHIQFTQAHTCTRKYYAHRHLCGHKRTFTMCSEAQYWHNNGRQRRPDWCTSPVGVWGDSYALTFYTKTTQSTSQMSISQRRERLLKQLGDHKVREIHKRQSDKNYVDGKERDRKMSNRATRFTCFFGKKNASVDWVTPWKEGHQH